MRFIAHRGNYAGAQPAWENTSDYLKFAYYDKGYDVECDLLSHRGVLYYGHDEPQEVADTGFIQQPGVFCHAKNLEALELLMSMRTNCFWHDVDKCTLTRDGYIWCFPGENVQHPRAIWLELGGVELPMQVEGIYGYCGDKINENINIWTTR